MDIRFLITSLLLAVAWASEAAVPQLTDFNTNQFGTAGGIVTIKNGALVTNLVGAGSGSSDWTNAAWGLQPVLTNSLVDIHHGTNAVWVNQLATGGNGTLANPWTGLESVVLTNSETHYYWPKGYYKTTNTLDLMGHDCFHTGEAGTTILFFGEGPAVRFSAGLSWQQGSVFENFRVEGSNAVRTLKTITYLTNSGSGTIAPVAIATCTNHGYSVGDIVFVQGASQADYNVVRAITSVPDTNTFTYQLIANSTAASPATTGSSIQCAKATVGLQLIGSRFSEYRNLSFNNCDLGVDIRACVTFGMRNVRCTIVSGGPQITTHTGFLIGKRWPSVADWTTTGVFDNLSAEYCSDFGVVIYEAFNLHFNVGTSESNKNGVSINGAEDSVFTAFDCEQNTGGIAWSILGNRQVLLNCQNQGQTIILGGWANRIEGGRHPSLTVGSAQSTASATLVDGCLINSGSFTNFTPAGMTRTRGLKYNSPPDPIDVSGPWMLGKYDVPVITVDAPLTLDASLASHYVIPFRSSFTMTNPLNPTVGEEMVIRFRHFADSNPYVISWSSIWRFPTWMTTPITNSTSGGVIYMKARYNGIDTNWDVTELVGVTGTLNQGTTNTVQHGNAAGNPAYSSVTEYDLGLTDITTANFSTNMHGFTPKGETNDQKYLQATGVWAVPTGSGVGANASEPYVTIGNVGSLSDERALTSGQVSITDNGAGSTVTIGATTDTPRFLRMGLGKAVDATASLTTVAPILSSDGSLTAPSYGWGSETNMGFYRRMANNIEFCVGGHSSFGVGNFLVKLGSTIPLTWVNAGVESGSTDTFLYRDAPATLQMGSDAPSPVTQKFKAHDGLGANISGASLTLAGGSGTGTGAGGDLITQTTVSSNASGSTLQIYSTRHYESAKPSPMTNSTANPVFNILIGSTHYFGCKIFATTFAADAGGDFQALSEELIISAVNKSGTISNTVSASWGSALAASVASTLTTTWTAVTSGASLDIKCTPVSSLTPTTYYTKWKVDVLSNDPATIAPYR